MERKKEQIIEERVREFKKDDLPWAGGEVMGDIHDQILRVKLMTIYYIICTYPTTEKI